jgi:hypothetical protein
MKRISWDEDQIESLAAAFVRLRGHDPFVAVRVLLKKAQDECLPEDEHRNLASVNVVPLLKERIRALFERAVQAEPSPPQIIEIPVEKPVDLLELSNRLDTPTLMALMTKRFGEVVDKIRFTTNGSEQHAATARADVPPISVLAPAPKETPRPIRVAFCGVDLPLFAKVKTELERNKIAVEIRGVDMGKRQQIPVSCDFVVFMKNATGGHAWKTALSAWPRARVFVLEQDTVDYAVQKMRDIASMKVHIPAHITVAGPVLNRAAA